MYFTVKSERILWHKRRESKKPNPIERELQSRDENFEEWIAKDDDVEGFPLAE